MNHVAPSIPAPLTFAELLPLQTRCQGYYSFNNLNKWHKDNNLLLKFTGKESIQLHILLNNNYSLIQLKNVNKNSTLMYLHITIMPLTTSLE